MNDADTIETIDGLNRVGCERLAAMVMREVAAKSHRLHRQRKDARREAFQLTRLADRLDRYADEHGHEDLIV